MSEKRGFFDDSEYYPKKDPMQFKEATETTHCQPEKPWGVNKFGAQKDMSEYQANRISVDDQFLLDCKESLEAGLEFTQGALSEHDVSLGRTTFKNKSWAETMEKSIAQMRSCVQRIEGFLAKF
jgi:hypothetical protein